MPQHWGGAQAVQTDKTVYRLKLKVVYLFVSCINHETNETKEGEMVCPREDVW